MLYVSVCVLQPCRICASRSPSALRLQLAPRQRATSAMPSLHHRRPRSQYGRFLRIPRIARRRVSCHVAPVARGYVCSNGMSRLFFGAGFPCHLLQQQTAWRQYVRLVGSEELASGLPETDSTRAFYEAQGLGEDLTARRPASPARWPAAPLERPSSADAIRGVTAAFSEDEERRSERSLTRTPESVLVSEADDGEGYVPER
jgi:hypothetical protein